jgi:hypothetical protein
MPIFIRERLKAALPKPYYADINEKAYVEMFARYIEPDAQILRRNTPTPTRPPVGTGGGGVAVLPPPAATAAPSRPPVTVSVVEEETTERFVEVFRKADGRERLVTVIEILSPGNKAAGSTGRAKYLEKQREYLDAEVHLIEIDLLRAGQHTTAVPLPAAGLRAGRFDYHVCLRRFDLRRGDYLVWPISLSERLPVLEVPLLPGDGSVPLDLQAVFDRCYDTGPYEDRIDYSRPPLPPLTPEQAEWAKGMLAAAGRTG